MATKTLLDIVQSILSDANGDEVNSISDTVEAGQCASIIKSVYEDIRVEYDIQAVKTLFRLDGYSDSNRPTHMKVPKAIHSVEWIKYDVRLGLSAPPVWKDIRFATPSEFMSITNQRAGSSEAVEVPDPSGVKLWVYNDRPPSLFTMFDDRTVVFDAFNADVEATLHQTKTQAYGRETDDMVVADATEIKLPEHLLQLLANEARAMFFDVHADGAPQRVERRASWSRARAKRLAHTMRIDKTQTNTGPDYGRRPRGSSRR